MFAHAEERESERELEKQTAVSILFYNFVL